MAQIHISVCKQFVLTLSRCNHSTSLYGTFISNLLVGSALNALDKMCWIWKRCGSQLLISHLRRSRIWAVDQTPPLYASVVTETSYTSTTFLYTEQGRRQKFEKGFRSAAEGSEQRCVVLMRREPGNEATLVAPSPLCTALLLLSGFPAIRDRVSLSTWEIMQAVIAHAYTNPED